MALILKPQSAVLHEMKAQVVHCCLEFPISAIQGCLQSTNCASAYNGAEEMCKRLQLKEEALLNLQFKV